MHFGRARLPHHIDDFTDRRTPDDRIIDEHDALAVEAGPVGGVFAADSDLAAALGRLNEGAADIVVANEARFKRPPDGFGESERRRHAGVGHRGDHIDIGGRLLRENAPQIFTDIVDGASFDKAVGAREIDIFEGANPRRRRLLRREVGMHAVRIAPDHFAGSDVPFEFCADGVKRTGFRRQDGLAVKPAKHQRANADRVARADQRVIR